MKILISGFEPFGGNTLNVSQEVVRMLEQIPLPGVRLDTIILPVDRTRCADLLLARVEQSQPQAVLCLGEAKGRSRLSIERVAINLLDFSIQDNQGHLVLDEPVIPDGPPAFFVTMPVREIMTAIKCAHVPVELSLSAGAFICNQVLYALLHELSQRAKSETFVPPIWAGFIHLPLLPEEVNDLSIQCASMSLETSVRGIRAALERLSALERSAQQEP